MDTYYTQDISTQHLENMLNIYKQDTIAYNKHKIVIDLFSNFISTWRQQIYFIHISYTKNTNTIDFRFFLHPNVTDDVKRIIYIALCGLLSFIGISIPKKELNLYYSSGQPIYPDTVSILYGLSRYSIHNNLPLIMVLQ